MTVLDIRVIAISYDLHAPLNTAKAQFATISLNFVKATGQSNKLSVSLSLCLSVSISVSLCLRLSVCMSVSLSVWLTIKHVT